MTMSQQASEVNWDIFQTQETPDEEYFTQQAQFCIASGFVQPSEYDQMTQVQVAAWIEILNERNNSNK